MGEGDGQVMICAELLVIGETLFEGGFISVHALVINGSTAGEWTLAMYVSIVGLGIG